jgi:transposase
VTVVEVDRPDRKARRAKGKSDPLDAYSAAGAALARTATGVPKAQDGRIEAIRLLRVARSSAVKARSQAINQLKALLVTAPAQLREQLRTLSNTKLIATCARLRPTGDIADPARAIKTALRRLARRHGYLSEEITGADTELRTLVTAAAPRLIALPGSAPKSPGRYSSRPVTTPTGCIRRPRSLTCVGLLRSRPVAVGPTATGSTVAATAVRTTPSTSW